MRAVTYSPSVTRILSRFCEKRCLYCGFHRSDPALASPEDVARSLGSDAGSEVLLMSGEEPDRSPAFLGRLKAMGFNSLAEHAAETCRRILEMGLLPHVNLGMLDREGLSRLRRYCPSIGIMVENIDIRFGRRVHPGKDIAARLRTAELAGQLKIPLTTGILVGIGETQESRIASLDEILEMHSRHGHVQEIILQPFVPNARSAVRRGSPVAPGQMLHLVRHILTRARSSGIPPPGIQVPPNLLPWEDPFWADLLEAGVNDLGGISAEADAINPERPWPSVAEIEERLSRLGFRLRRRLPVYTAFLSRRWLSDETYEAASRLLRDGSPLTSQHARSDPAGPCCRPGGGSGRGPTARLS